MKVTMGRKAMTKTDGYLAGMDRTIMIMIIMGTIGMIIDNWIELMIWLNLHLRVRKICGSILFQVYVFDIIVLVK